MLTADHSYSSFKTFWVVPIWLKNVQAGQGDESTEEYAALTIAAIRDPPLSGKRDEMWV